MVTIMHSWLLGNIKKSKRLNNRDNWKQSAALFVSQQGDAIGSFAEFILTPFRRCKRILWTFDQRDCCALVRALNALNSPTKQRWFNIKISLARPRSRRAIKRSLRSLIPVQRYVESSARKDVTPCAHVLRSSCVRVRNLRKVSNVSTFVSLSSSKLPVIPFLP